MRLKFFGRSVRPARTAVRDAAPTLTQDAAEPVATFGRGHTAKAHSDGLRVHDAAGVHVATFHTPHIAQPSPSGGLHIFAKPRITTDAPLSARLADLNRRNTEFYRPREGKS